MIQKFPFTYASDEYTSCTCIYKLCFNDRFFVAGCKRLKKRAQQHSEEIERKLRLGLKENDPYANIINYIKENNVQSFTVEIIFPVAFESELPDYEQRIFDLVKDNPKCLNTSFTAQQRSYRQKKEQYQELNTMKNLVGVEDLLPAKFRKPAAAVTDRIKSLVKEENHIAGTITVIDTPQHQYDGEKKNIETDELWQWQPLPLPAAADTMGKMIAAVDPHRIDESNQAALVQVTTGVLDPISGQPVVTYAARSEQASEEAFTNMAMFVPKGLLTNPDGSLKKADPVPAAEKPWMPLEEAKQLDNIKQAFSNPFAAALAKIKATYGDAK